MEQLVRRAMRSDTDAFLELMERNTLAMYKVARGILKNEEDVADAVQNTILTCFEKIHTLQRCEYFKTWLIRVLINECNQIIRQNRRLNVTDEAYDAGSEDMSLAEFEFKEMLSCVDGQYRTVLVLYYVEGFKIAEIAGILGLNENTVKTRLARAREQIRQVYSDYPDAGRRQLNRADKERGVSDEKTDRLQCSQEITTG